MLGLEADIPVYFVLRCDRDYLRMAQNITRAFFVQVRKLTGGISSENSNAYRLSVDTFSRIFLQISPFVDGPFFSLVFVCLVLISL